MLLCSEDAVSEASPRTYRVATDGKRGELKADARPSVYAPPHHWLESSLGLVGTQVRTSLFVCLFLKKQQNIFDFKALGNSYLKKRMTLKHFLYIHLF